MKPAKNGDKDLNDKDTGNSPREQIKSPLLVQSEVPVNTFPQRGEAASLAFTIPSQLDTYKKPNSRSLLGADCLHRNPPPQEKVCSASPKGREDSRTGLLRLRSPSSLPVFLHVREMPRTCFLLQTTHLLC